MSTEPAVGPAAATTLSDWDGAPGAFDYEELLRDTRRPLPQDWTKEEVLAELQRFFRDPGEQTQILKPGMSSEACENIRIALNNLGYIVGFGKSYDHEL